MKRFKHTSLTSRRKELRMTQQELADAACLSTVSVSQLENGRKEPKAGTVARLAEALSCSVDYFFG